MSEPRPNFFVIGAMRSGTTSLHHYLGTHPDVFMCSPKEPSHFVERRHLREEWPEMERSGYWRRSNYLSLFAAAGHAKVRGESSTNYSKLSRISGVAARIAEFDPTARILYLMRNPIERTLSHYWNNVKWDSETLGPLEAIRTDPRYRQVSHYAFQLAEYFEYFPRGSVFTLTTESLAARPLEAVQEIFQWLGVDPSFVPPNLSERQNAMEPEVSQARGRGWLWRLRGSATWGWVSPMVPAWLRGVGRRVSERSVDVSSVSVHEVVEHLAPLQRAETAELSRLLGRSFPEWAELYEE